MPAHRPFCGPTWHIPVGAKFGRLTVAGPVTILEVGRRPCRFPAYPCVCQCGGERIVRAASLLSGETLSCGCLQREVASERTRGRTPGNHKHGVGRHRLYGVWRQMIQRCSNPEHKSYPDYGGRGITVCPEWHDVAAFYEWAIHHPEYRPGLTLDRIDNGGNYEPSNCRWASRLEQNQKRRNSPLIEAFQESKVAAAWERDPRCVVTRKTIRNRMNAGWSAEAAITIPSRESP